MHVSTLKAATIALALACCTAAPAAAAPRPAGIKVKATQGDAAGQVLVTFRSLKCTAKSTGFHGRARAGGWSLLVRIRRFKGFRRYRLPYGLPARTSFQIEPPSGAPSYSNIWKPDPIPLPEFGGAVAFPGGRKRLYLGFPSAFNSVELPATGRVAVVGKAACRYPSKRRR